MAVPSQAFLMYQNNREEQAGQTSVCELSVSGAADHSLIHSFIFARLFWKGRRVEDNTLHYLGVLCRVSG